MTLPSQMAKGESGYIAWHRVFINEDGECFIDITAPISKKKERGFIRLQRVSSELYSLYVSEDSDNNIENVKPQKLRDKNLLRVYLY